MNTPIDLKIKNIHIAFNFDEKGYFFGEGSQFL